MLTHVNLSPIDRVIAAALVVLRRDGLDGVTMRAVAREAGVTATALYRHVRDREDLIQALRLKVAAQFRDRLLEALTYSSAERRLVASVEAFARFAVETPHGFDLLFLEAPGSGMPPGARLRRSGTIFQLLVDRVRECMHDGHISRGDPVDAALMLAGLGQGLVLLYRRERFGKPEEFLAFVRASVRTLVAGMRPSPIPQVDK